MLLTWATCFTSKSGAVLSHMSAYLGGKWMGMTFAWKIFHVWSWNVVICHDFSWNDIIMAFHLLPPVGIFCTTVALGNKDEPASLWFIQYGIRVDSRGPGEPTHDPVDSRSGIGGCGPGHAVFARKLPEAYWQKKSSPIRESCQDVKASHASNNPSELGAARQSARRATSSVKKTKNLSKQLIAQTSGFLKCGYPKPLVFPLRMPDEQLWTTCSCPPLARSRLGWLAWHGENWRLGFIALSKAIRNYRVVQWCTPLTRWFSIAINSN